MYLRKAYINVSYNIQIALLKILLLIVLGLCLR
jgi:hypothetical protein